MKIFGLFTFLFLIGNSYSSFAQTAEVWDLEKCVNYALINNITIQRSELGVKYRETDFRESKFSRLPNLTASGQTGYRWGRSIDPVSNQFETSRIGSIGFSASSGVTLFSGFQINNSISQNKVDLEVSKYDLEDTKNNVILSVINHYLDVVFYSELQKNAERQLEVADAQLIQTTRMVEAGSLPISDQLEQEAQKASFEVESIRAKNEKDLAILRLKQLLLLPAQQPFNFEVPEVSVEEISMEGYNAFQIFDIAMETQPSIKSAELRVKSSDLGLKIARGGVSPVLSISANVFTNYSDAAMGPIITGVEPQRFVTEVGYLQSDESQRVVTVVEMPQRDQDYSPFEQFKDNLSQSLTLNLSVPIFNNYRTRASIQRAVIAKEESILAREEVQQQLRQNIESAYSDAFAASKTYYASLKQVEALEESFRAVDKRFNLGAVDFVSYQVVQNNLFNAQYELLRAKYNYIFRIKVLDFYMGNPLSLK